MKKLILILLFFALFWGCSSNVHFMKIDDSYTPSENPPGTDLVFTPKKIKRPHRVVGIIEAVLGRGASRAQLDALLMKKGMQVGVDGIMLVKYNVDRQQYIKNHHAVVGRGPWRRHVTRKSVHVDVKKNATGIAVKFK